MRSMGARDTLTSCKLQPEDRTVCVIPAGIGIFLGVLGFPSLFPSSTSGSFHPLFAWQNHGNMIVFLLFLHNDTTLMYPNISIS